MVEKSSNVEFGTLGKTAPCGEGNTESIVFETSVDRNNTLVWQADPTRGDSECQFILIKGNFSLHLRP